MFFYLSLSQSYHTPEAASTVDRDGVGPLFRFSLFRFFDAGGSAAGGAAGGTAAGGAAGCAGGAAGRQTPPLQWLSVFFGNAAPQPGHVDSLMASSFWCFMQKTWLQQVTMYGS